eukprot:COSAG02_NODE_999_length_15328_cov_8.086360_6_plen_47_part_00
MPSHMNTGKPPTLNRRFALTVLYSRMGGRRILIVRGPVATNSDLQV